MLQLALQAIVSASYVFACVYHIKDIMYIPLPFVGLAWVISLRFAPPLVPKSALSWVTYAILVYQTLTFHDLDACLLEECKTDMLYEYVMLIGTAVLWLSMKETGKEGHPKTEIGGSEPNIDKIQELEPKIKLEVSKPSLSVEPVRLNMGVPLQPKWV